MIAILLAGGKGERLRQSGKTGRFIPKPLIPIGTEPVINQIVNHLLRLSDPVTHEGIDIYVLARKEQTHIGDGGKQENEDLEKWFTRWKDVWYSDGPDADRVKLVFQDDLPKTSIPEKGAILGLYRFLLWTQAPTPEAIPYQGQTILPPDLKKSSHVLIFAADNYFEDDLSGLVEECGRHPRAIINAYFDFGDKEKIREKYGAVQINNHKWIFGYEEKPPQPTAEQTKASTAIYAYPVPEFLELKNYVENYHAPYSLDAPGNLLKWFINDYYPKIRFPNRQYNQPESEEGVRGYKLNCSHWYDIGNQSDLTAAVVWYTRTVISSFDSVADLRRAQETGDLNDKYYYLCHELEVRPETRTISLFFNSEDKICKLKKEMPGNIPSVREVKDGSKDAQFWLPLMDALRPGTSPTLPRFERQKLVDKQSGASKPIHISTGIFFLDCVPPSIDGSHHVLSRQRALIPFLEKDAGSITDAGRITTPAGRLDILNLERVSFFELAEEMIFYGTNKDSEQPTIYCCAPLHITGIKQRILLNILKKGIEIPAMDRERIAEQAVMTDPGKITLVENIPPYPISLPAEYNWTVDIYLDDRLESRCSNVIVIPDRENATLEFRLLYVANLSGLEKIEEVSSRRVGKLMGIADGDKFGRRSLLVTAEELYTFYHINMQRPQADVLDYLFQSQNDSISILAIGDANTGRFTQFGAKMPVLTFTSSVRYLAELLKHITS